MHEDIAVLSQDFVVEIWVVRPREMVSLTSAPNMRAGTSENWWVISKTMRIDVNGARTTALRQALIPMMARRVAPSAVSGR